MTTPHTSIVFQDDAQHDRLSAVREAYGVSWRGMLVQGALRLLEADRRVQAADTEYFAASESPSLEGLDHRRGE